MKLEQSQLEYLNKRNGNYDRKYRMFEKLIDKVPLNLNYVVELFGGVGIETYYLKNNKNIKKHTVIDKDINCCSILNKNIKNIEVLNIDTFTFNTNKKINLLICDSVFNNKEYNKITNFINTLDFEYLILTNTGVFNVRFNKELSYDDYWNNLIEKLKKQNLYATNVVYSSDFGMILIEKKENNLCEIERLNNNNVSTNWRNYVKEIKHGIQKV